MRGCWLVTAGADDPRLRQWSGRLERLAASPGTAAQIVRMNSEVDVRPVLPSIQAPTLVHAPPRGSQFIDNRHSLYLAEHIPGARLVELPGTQTLPFGPGQDDVRRRDRGVPHRDARARPTPSGCWRR